jgi:hypothetical protein
MNYDDTDVHFWREYVSPYSYPPPATWTKEETATDQTYSIYCTYSTDGEEPPEKHRRRRLIGGDK